MIAHVATAFAVAIAAGQYKAAVNQFQQTSERNRVGSVFAILAEGSDVRAEIARNPQVYDYITSFSETADYSDEVENEAKGRIHQLISFYAAVHNHFERESFEDSLWPIFEEEIHTSICQPPIRDRWESFLSKRAFPESFKSMLADAIRSCPAREPAGSQVHDPAFQYEPENIGN